MLDADAKQHTTDLVGAARDQDVAQKFFAIEVRMLSILRFKDFFNELPAVIQEQFGVPYVWMSLLGQTELTRLIQAHPSYPAFDHSVSFVAGQVFRDLVKNDYPVLINGDLEPYQPLFPPGQMHFVRSLAIAPLSLDGDLIGSLNQADLSRLRYRPGMDTRLLRQLAVKLSISLSNVTAHEQLRHLAWQDPLTGVGNRRELEAVLHREYRRAMRYRGLLTLAFVDLDDFKQVNDEYGHRHGDEILRHVARTMAALTRDGDLVARYAGDEFVMVLPGAAPQDADRLIERLRDELVSQPPRLLGRPCRISFSHGIASTQDSGIDGPLSLLERADGMLYAAKAAKKPNLI